MFLALSNPAQWLPCWIIDQKIRRLRDQIPATSESLSHDLFYKYEIYSLRMFL